MEFPIMCKKNQSKAKRSVLAFYVYLIISSGDHQSFWFLNSIVGSWNYGIQI